MKTIAAALLPTVWLAGWLMAGPALAEAGDPARDARFVEEVSRAGLARLEAAERALAKAGDRRVRILAERIIEDQRPINEELSVLASDAGIAAAAPESTTEPAGDLSTLSGAAFDKAWLKAEMAAQRTLIDLFDRQSKDGADTSLKTFAANHLVSLRDHLDIAQSLGDELGSAASPE
jgi:putative membrane protein